MHSRKPTTGNFARDFLCLLYYYDYAVICCCLVSLSSTQSHFVCVFVTMSPPLKEVGMA